MDTGLTAKVFCYANMNGTSSFEYQPIKFLYFPIGNYKAITQNRQDFCKCECFIIIGKKGTSVRCLLAHLSRILEWAIVIAHRPSVRPSVRRKLFTFSTSSPEPLDGFWWNLVGMKYSWSFTSVVVFRPDPPRDGSRRGHNRSRGSPCPRNFFFRPEGYSDKPNG